MRMTLNNGLQAEIARITPKQMSEMVDADGSRETTWFLAHVRKEDPFRVTVSLGNERVHLIYLLRGFPNAKQWLKNGLQQRFEDTLEYPAAIIYKRTCYTYLKNLHLIIKARRINESTSTTYYLLRQAIMTGTPPRIVALLRP